MVIYVCPEIGDLGCSVFNTWYIIFFSIKKNMSKQFYATFLQKEVLIWIIISPTPLGSSSDQWKVYPPFVPPDHSSIIFILLCARSLPTSTYFHDLKFQSTGRKTEGNQGIELEEIEFGASTPAIFLCPVVMKQSFTYS